MSGQINIEKVALDFMKVYKRYKENSFRARKDRNEGGDNLLNRNTRRRGRLDKHPC